MLSLRIVLASVFVPCIAALANINGNPFAELHRQTRRAASPNNLTVDLGYAVYQGIANSSTGLDTWKGIRFADSPAGNNRFQLPKVPPTNRSSVIVADKFASQCPQTSNSNGTAYALGVTGDEDCLFLNVYAPSNISARNPLPVLVWIHGGGYGLFNGTGDLSPLIISNSNGFVGVAIQYRLGAFGFLASDAVQQFGALNAGIHDQIQALQWVQSYIHLFGGDPTRVTISGESAGGGAVMLLDMANGGTLGTSLFVNSITASPYLPQQYNYNDALPTQAYLDFATEAGCSNASTTNETFQCLVSQPSEVLQNASSYVSTSAVFGTWAFLPVTDGTLIQDLPSIQLQQKRVNGKRMLTGNNAIEGSLFVPNNITTQEDLISWIQTTFPQLPQKDIQTVLNTYPSPDVAVNANAPLFATNGITGPTSINQSSLATGQQQRAFAIYAESTFVCPSYWLGEAYHSSSSSSSSSSSYAPSSSSSNSSSSASYKYQYSITPGTHGQDVSAYFTFPGTNNPPHTADFALAFQQIWGSFVINGNPSISSFSANGVSIQNNSVNPASNWPEFVSTTSTSTSTTNGAVGGRANEPIYQMINLNESSTEFISVAQTSGPAYTFPYGPDVRNDFSLVDARLWEGGRGARCDVWRSLGGNVPERKKRRRRMRVEGRN